ncbi:putative fad binding domain containing protein [Eutypa lata UCREL1]|uniref:Putative fad binding domain containing protein n=1 Tax=Eutypa lata (strain UCR-EL1) TaxID=1287681 RepID=M7SL35_EUTLA|nr:putative fad binding domain containing protein [Eutypa lata UCREL1]
MSASVVDCCSALESSGLKNVIYPGDEVYESRIESYFSVSAQLKPFCLVQPTTAEEVALAVTLLIKNTTCEFAIRSGGHTVWPGAANTNVGVTIDLGLMKNTTYVPETKIAQIQAGSRWRDVYEELTPYGVTVPGGRTNTVGVAGFLTGGGNTFYTARRGFGCDNVVNFEVVLANGEITNANAEQNPDLFKALKGGSANFGIVTRFDMQAFEAPELWGGLVTYPASTGDQHIAAYVDWTNNIENYPDGSAIVFFSYEPNVQDIIITAAYDDTTGAVAPPAFDKFMAIPDQMTNSLRKDSHLNLTNELELVGGYRNVWFGIAFHNDIRMYEKAVEMHRRFVEDWKAQLSPDGDFICHAIFQALPTIFSRHSVERGGNVMGLDRETQNSVMFQVQLAFRGDVEKERTARERVAGFRTALKGHSAELGAAVDWEYLNYADYTQNPLKTYGEENVAFTREVAVKYDPAGVFQTRMPGGFKISRVD